MRRLVLLTLGAACLVGCGGPANGTAAHTSEEEKAVREAQSLTPQQQLERAEASQLPADQKAALINSIKAKHGLK
ncbi:MAG: hypothetical protein ACO1SV_09475 [Fimbriimonas sp.]